MKTEELKEYLGIVVDMEESIFLRENLIDKIKHQIEILKIPEAFTDPVEPAEPKRLPALTAGDLIMSIIYLGLISFGLWFISGLVITVFLGLQRAITGTCTEWLILLSFVAPAVKTYCFVAARKKETNDNKKLLKQYQLQLSKYKEMIEKNYSLRQQDEANRNTKTAFLLSQQKEVEKGLAESKDCLQKIYAKNIIFPKYRNFAMVASLYEYVSAGRCSTLEGPEGAYNILEMEMRLDRITCQLDQVITHLDKIQKNQFMLFSAVQDANCQMGKILESSTHMVERLDAYYQNSLQLNEQAAELNTHIAELQKTSELTAYQTERTQKELEYMNRMDYLTGRNDGVFFNRPPV